MTNPNPSAPRTFPLSIRSLGRSGSRAAVAWNRAAVAWNRAALAQIRLTRPEFVHLRRLESPPSPPLASNEVNFSCSPTYASWFLQQPTAYLQRFFLPSWFSNLFFLVLAASMSSAGSGMAGSQSSVGGSSNNTASADGEDAPTGVVNRKYPLWAHCTKISADETGAGGNKKVRCNFCNCTFMGSYSRVRAHLLHIEGNGVDPCNKLPNHIFTQHQRRSRTIVRRLFSTTMSGTACGEPRAATANWAIAIDRSDAPLDALKYHLLTSDNLRSEETNSREKQQNLRTFSFNHMCIKAEDE